VGETYRGIAVHDQSTSRPDHLKVFIESIFPYTIIDGVNPFPVSQGEDLLYILLGGVGSEEDVVCSVLFC
jgi:hypothetical protein